MSLVPAEPWYRDALAAVQAQQAGVLDYLGRPWAEHFERVALRVIFRNPRATRHQVTAALLHDVFMERGGGQELLDRLAVDARAIEIIERTTPPPDADYFRKFELIGPAQTATYLEYVRTLAASGDREAIEMKLADITDTIDACRQGATSVLAGQFHNRYEPSRRLLEAALSPAMGPGLG